VRPIRLLAIIEASTVTGPAKNLLQFGQLGPECDPPVELTVVTFRRGAAGADGFLDAVKEAGLPLRVIPESGAYDRTVLDRLRQAVREEQPTVIQSHAVKSHFLVRSSGLHRELPWVASHHGYTWPSLKARVYNGFDQWSLRAARRVLTVTNAFVPELMARGVKRERLEVIHNAIAPVLPRPAGEVAALRARWGLSVRDRTILSVGRLSREKDHIALLEAFAGLAVPATRLLIVGEGPERARIEAGISRLGIGERVILTGQQSSAMPFYAVADLAVLPSRSEGSPNALLEAMAAGVPAVATRVGGVPEIACDGETALLVPAGETGALRTAMGRLLEDAGLSERLASAARQLVEREYTPRSRAQRLAAFYRGVLEEGPAQRS
jgi:glycosyltransferase involved in cell wall biosynthesis